MVDLGAIAIDMRLLRLGACGCCCVIVSHIDGSNVWSLMFIKGAA